MKPKAIIELREGEKVEIQVVYKVAGKETREIYELYPRMCGHLHMERMEK